MVELPTTIRKQSIERQVLNRGRKRRQLLHHLLYLFCGNIIIFPSRLATINQQRHQLPVFTFLYYL